MNTVRQIPLDGLHKLAEQRAAEIGELPDSMRGTAANEIGRLGELVAMRYLDLIGVPYHDENKFNHDLRTAFGTVDVKTKDRTVQPRPNYECSVSERNRKLQQPDWYLFVSLQRDGTKGITRFRRGWVLGTISHESFWDAAKFRGDDYHDESNDWDPTIPCWNVPISRLRPPSLTTSPEHPTSATTEPTPE